MKKGQTIYFADKVKEELKRMSEETGISQSDLIKMATISMLANYKAKGSFIFADLLNPDHKWR